MPTSKNLATSLHTAPGFSRDDLATLSGALGDLGFDVHTKEVAPQPQMAVEWFLPAAITWLTSPAGMAVIGTATVTGVFTKVGEQIFTGLMKALKAGKKLDYRFRNSQEYETGAPGKAAPLIKVRVELPPGKQATAVQFIIPADLPEESWPTALKSLLETFGSEAIQAAQHPPHPGPDFLLVDDNGKHWRAPDYVYISGVGWVNAHEALDEIVQRKMIDGVARF